VINVITRAEPQSFPAGYYYMRMSASTPNNFFNNAAGARVGTYRYKTMAEISAARLHSETLQPQPDKLFFFFAQEFLPTAPWPRIHAINRADAASGKGDFNQSVGATNGSLYSAARSSIL